MPRHKCSRLGERQSSIGGLWCLEVSLNFHTNGSPIRALASGRTLQHAWSISYRDDTDEQASVPRASTDNTISIPEESPLPNLSASCPFDETLPFGTESESTSGAGLLYRLRVIRQSIQNQLPGVQPPIIEDLLLVQMIGPKERDPLTV